MGTKGPLLALYPGGLLGKWSFLIDHLGRECRDWPLGEANSLFEDLLESLGSLDPDTVVLATDGSVSREPPRSGWGCVLRTDSGVRAVAAGGCRLVLSSMRTEMEAVSQGLQLIDAEAPESSHIIVVTDSQSLLRRLAGGWSPPEWQDGRKTINWTYCPGHSGIALNERADRLAGGSTCTSRICLSVDDIKSVIREKQRTTIATTDNREIERMMSRGLNRGWVRKSRRSGSAIRLSGQLATGTVSRWTLLDVVALGGAEAAWRRHFGSRSAWEAAARE